MDQLRPELSDVELIELCMVVGHYEMLGMTLNALAVEPTCSGVARRPRLAPGTEVHATATARAKDTMRRGPAKASTGVVS